MKLRKISKNPGVSSETTVHVGRHRRTGDRAAGVVDDGALDHAAEREHGLDFGRGVPFDDLERRRQGLGVLVVLDLEHELPGRQAAHDGPFATKLGRVVRRVDAAIGELGHVADAQLVVREVALQAQ